jgi:hypothetical protein
MHADTQTHSHDATREMMVPAHSVVLTVDARWLTDGTH